MGRKTEFAANRSPGPAERKDNENALPSTLVYDHIYPSKPNPSAQGFCVRCFKEICQVGKVGKVGKVGEVGKVGKEDLIMPTWNQL